MLLYTYTHTPDKHIHTNTHMHVYNIFAEDTTSKQHQPDSVRLGRGLAVDISQCLNGSASRTPE